MRGRKMLIRANGGSAWVPLKRAEAERGLLFERCQYQRWNWVQNPEDGKRGLFVVEFTPQQEAWAGVSEGVADGSVGVSVHVALEVKCSCAAQRGKERNRFVPRVTVLVFALDAVVGLGDREVAEVNDVHGWVAEWPQLFGGQDKMSFVFPEVLHKDGFALLEVDRDSAVISSGGWQWDSWHTFHGDGMESSRLQQLRWFSVIICDWRSASAAELSVQASLSDVEL